MPSRLLKKNNLINCSDDSVNIFGYGSVLTMSLTNLSCLSNCSGHGDCYDGECFCEVEYAGRECNNPNFGYFCVFSSIFYVICVTSLLQLILCIKSEFNRLKPRSLLRSLKITTQKALYFFIFVATAVRGFYFASALNPSLKWANSLMNAYYPFVLSGSSLVVCFWAEVFHLYDVNIRRPSFLSKSFFGFLLFNVINYSLLLAEFALFHYADRQDYDKGYFLRIFNGIYAVLMLIVVIFFLIYGIEVYFKMRGAFIQGKSSQANVSQLKQSRLGLISQATMLTITVLFIFSEVLENFWKEKVAVPCRNIYQIMFRVVEIGIALWYPCVLWNCIRPERLWILNPRRILSRDQKTKCTNSKSLNVESESLMANSVSFLKLDKQVNVVSTKVQDCWICYDSERTDAGSLIQPCSCKGDVSIVHHECLKQWLVESHSNPENILCKVCKDPYIVSKGYIWLPAGLTVIHWFQTALIITIMCSIVAGTCLILKLFQNMSVRTITVGCTILAEYICLRFLGFNLLSAYQRAKFSAMKILNREGQNNLNTNLDQKESDNPSIKVQSTFNNVTFSEVEEVKM